MDNTQLVLTQQQLNSILKQFKIVDENIDGIIESIKELNGS